MIFSFRRNFLIFIILVSGNGISLSLDREIKSPVSVFKEKFNAIKNWGCEVFFADFFGYESLSPENESFVRDILVKLGATQEIAVRRMSKAAIRLCGYQNAFFTMNYLFISEDWFDTLTTQEKQFLIAHEAIHAKERHDVQKGLLYLVLAYFLMTNQKGAIKTYSETEKGLVKNLCIALPFFGYSRYLEKRADIESARALDNAKDGVTLMQRWKNETLDAESKFFLRRLYGLYQKYIEYYFAQSHPFLEDREAYLSKLALEQSRV